MVRRLALLAVVAAASIAATSPPPPPPSVLAPYIKGGIFDPGDYGWIRGSFAGATPAERADWDAVIAWRKQCHVDRIAQVRAGLAQRGVTLTTPDVGHADGPCAVIGFATMPRDAQGDSWPAFQAALASAKPIAQTIVWSAGLAQAYADPDDPDEVKTLVARPATDQVLRRALEWDAGELKGAPQLAPAVRSIAESMIWLAIAARDRANTAWLKADVAAHGWPTIARVGSQASSNAWLIAQHSDDDPLFQLDMLRLMEPLATRGEIARRNYAMLYDRVMLKLTGRQRYATQFTCIDGRHTPRPLEDAAAVAERRASMGMSTLAENRAQIERLYGPCPPEAIPPATMKR